KAAPSSSFKMIETNFLLEVLIVALNGPAQLGEVHQAFEGDVLGQGCEPIFGGRSVSAPRPDRCAALPSAAPPPDRVAARARPRRARQGRRQAPTDRRSRAGAGSADPTL